MTYSKQTWANGPLGSTPISADRLNHIEEGIETLESGLSGAYVQPAALDVRARLPVRVSIAASAFNQASAPATVDGLALAGGDRVGVTDGINAGIWVYPGVGLEWTRATDADALNDLGLGTFFVVKEGSRAGQMWVVRESYAPVVTSHAEVRVVSTIFVNQGAAPASVDGVTLAVGDRVLFTANTTLNGIWVFPGTGLEFTRATDADASGELAVGNKVRATAGSQAGKYWELLTSAATPWVPNTSTTWGVHTPAPGPWQPGSISNWAPVTPAGATTTIANVREAPINMAHPPYNCVGAATPADFDCLPKVQAAVATFPPVGTIFGSNSGGGGGSLYFPTADKPYQYGAPWDIDTLIHLKGDGIGDGYMSRCNTMFMFPNGTRGIRLSYNVSGSGTNSVFEDFGIQSNTPGPMTSPIIPGAHGLTIHASSCTVRNVHVMGFGDQGMRFDGADSPTHTADICRVEYCRQTLNRGHGLVFTGFDAVLNVIINNDSRLNGLWGVYDGGAHQHYISPHFDGNQTGTMYLLGGFGRIDNLYVENDFVWLVHLDEDNPALGWDIQGNAYAAPNYTGNIESSDIKTSFGWNRLNVNDATGLMMTMGRAPRPSYVEYAFAIA